MSSPLTLPLRYTRQKPPVGAPLRASALRRGLVGWYSCNEGAGSAMYDASGYHRHGSLVGTATWLPAPRAVSLPGTSGNYASTPASVLGACTSPSFSTLCRFRVSAIAASMAIFDSYTGGNSQNCFFGLRTASTVIIYYGHNAGLDIPINLTVVANQWYDVVVTVNGVTCYIYFNGLLAGSSAYANVAPLPVPTQFAQNPSFGNPIEPTDIDFFGVWSRALSPGEVRSLFLAPFSKY